MVCSDARLYPTIHDGWSSWITKSTEAALSIWLGSLTTSWTWYVPGVVAVNEQMSGVCGEGQAERLVVPGWVTVHLKVRLFASSSGSEDPAASFCEFPINDGTLRRPRGPTREHHVEPACHPGSASAPDDRLARDKAERCFPMAASFSSVQSPPDGCSLPPTPFRGLARSRTVLRSCSSGKVPEPAPEEGEIQGRYPEPSEQEGPSVHEQCGADSDQNSAQREFDFLAHGKTPNLERGICFHTT